MNMIRLTRKIPLDSLRKFGIIFSSTIHTSHKLIHEYRGVFAMKKILSMRRIKEEMSSVRPSETTYENAMRVYKLFAYVSGAVVTVAYVVSQLF